MAALGFSPDDFGDDVIGIWPENLEAFNAFLAVSTQWRIGMAGPTGLDYGVFNDVFRLKQIPESDWPDVFSSIQVMEDAALHVMHKKD